MITHCQLTQAIADEYWSSNPDEDPNARRLRRYSAGHRPNSSSALTQAAVIASRPSSRGSMGSEPIISADYDELARPSSQGSVGLSVGSGDGPGTRPSSRGLVPHISGDGILRPPSRGIVGLQNEMRPSSRGSVAFDGIRPSSRGSVAFDELPPSSFSNVGENPLDNNSDRPGSSRTGSVLDSESRPGTSGRDVGTPLAGSRPASRANVRFTDGSRPGSAMIPTHSTDGLDRPANVQTSPQQPPGFDRPQSVNTFVLPEVPSPRSSDSETDEVLPDAKQIGDE